MIKKGHIPHGLESFPYFVGGNSEIIHYTCNAPSKEILEKYGIKCIGNDFNCIDPKEVLRIPLRVYEGKGFSELKDREVLKINLENMLKQLK